MASMVLNSPRATELSIYVVRVFVELRSMLATNQELSSKLFDAQLAIWVSRTLTKKLALVACMRKLLTILNAMVRDSSPFSFAAHGLQDMA